MWAPRVIEKDCFAVFVCAIARVSPNSVIQCTFFFTREKSTPEGPNAEGTSLVVSILEVNDVVETGKVGLFQVENHDRVTVLEENYSEFGGNHPSYPEMRCPLTSSTAHWAKVEPAGACNGCGFFPDDWTSTRSNLLSIRTKIAMKCGKGFI